MTALSGAGIHHDQKFPSYRQLKWFLALLCLYYGLRLLFFAIWISPYVPPDEVTHFGIAETFSRSFLFPSNSPETYRYGLVTNIPWLYYWLMGKLLWLNVFGLPDLLFLRLLNIPFAFATLYFAWRLLCLITEDRLTQLVLFVVVTNTLMFTFLSASVSYDNLTNLLAAMAIYYLLAFLKKRSGICLGISFLCQLAGCLTKVAFLPLAMILLVLLVVREFRAFLKFPSVLKHYHEASGLKGLSLVAMIVLGLVLNIQLYVGNYYSYGTVNPDISEVLPLENAMQNRLAARGIIFKQFKEGQISYSQALAMASTIKHKGDRQGTVYLLRNYLARKNSGAPLLGPLEYIVPWTQTMLKTTLGVSAHIGMSANKTILLLINILFILSVLTFFRCKCWRDPTGLNKYMALLVVCYAVFLMYFVNYRIYKYNESFVVALQGRYLFPVLAPLYVLFSYSILKLFKRDNGRFFVAILVSIVWLFSDLPFFLYHATPDWFASSPWAVITG